MAKRILVPLDKAVQAESMVEAVGALARSTGAAVRLLHVAPRPDSITDDYGHVLVYADQESARLEAEAVDYLHAVSIGLENVPLEFGVRDGDAGTQLHRTRPHRQRRRAGVQKGPHGRDAVPRRAAGVTQARPRPIAP